MIISFLSDGLGNQMFQYAFARSLQIQTKQSLYFALNLFKDDSSNRMYALDNLNIYKNVKFLPNPIGEIALLVHRANNKMRVLRGEDNSQAYAGGRIVNADCNAVYYFCDFANINFSNSVTVRGYFQNYRNLEKYADVLKAELKIKIIPSEKNEEMLKKIANGNSVCVHVRRGDYLNPEWSYLNICNYDYYKKAMERVKEKVENPVFYIFSNSSEDIAWIKENYDFSEYNVEYVDLNNPDYEELRLMYSCKHFIISNSTFSWWAQWLGEYENKVVVAPSEWNRNDLGCHGIYMPEWEIVEV